MEHNIVRLGKATLLLLFQEHIISEELQMMHSLCIFQAPMDHLNLQMQAHHLFITIPGGKCGDFLKKIFQQLRVQLILFREEVTIYRHTT